MLEELKKNNERKNTRDIFSYTAPTVGKAAAIFFLDLMKNDMHIYPELMQIFLSCLEMKHVLLI